MRAPPAPARRLAAALLAVLLLTGLPAAADAGSASSPSWRPGMPPPIRSWREEILAPAEYADLARRWRAWAEENPGSALSRVELARALRYEGRAPVEERNALILEALEIDPDCPEALDALACTALGEKPAAVESLEEAVALGKRAIALAPDWPVPHFGLWSHAMALGRVDEARGHARALLEKGGHSAHVVDFGYNLLQSAPDGAVLLTNGDNDTYPLLGLQVARDVRSDVRVVNLSLLNVLGYAERVWSAGGRPGSRPPFEPDEIRALHDRWKKARRGGDDGAPARFSHAVVRALLRKAERGDWDGAVTFAVTVDPAHLAECPAGRRIEGILWRALPGEPADPADADPRVDADRTLALFRDAFRLDSATDYAFRWEESTASRPLMRNYPAVLRLAATARAEAGDLEAARWALDRAVEILEFHQENETAASVRKYRDEIDTVRAPDAEGMR